MEKINNTETKNLNHGQLKILSEQAKNAREKRYLEASKNRLEKIVETKIRTAFIGALAAFEEKFGSLWGHDKDDITPEQEEMYNIWEDARTQILNNGNNQIRAAKQEIENHVIKWNRYKYEFIPRER